MIRKYILALTVIIPTISGGATAENDTDKSITVFREYLADFRIKKRIVSLSVAVTKDDEVIYNEGFGWQDHDAEEPTTTDTSYLVASISKTFSAATLLAMEADGHIDLNDDFTKLSDWDRRCKWLTTSGIIFGGGTLENGTVIEAPKCDTSFSLRDVLQHRVNGEPGTNFVYNAVTYGRLSNWVEEQTGKPYRDWMLRYVIEPGGLSDIAAGWRHPGRGHVLSNIAPPFKFDKERNGRPVPSPLPNPELNASSGIIASAKSLAKYSIALDQGKILSPALLEKMWTPPTETDGSTAPYAYGWYVENWNDRKLVWHGGWWPDAYAGFILKIPEEKLSLVVVANTDGTRWPHPLDEGGVHKSEIAAKFLSLFPN